MLALFEGRIESLVPALPMEARGGFFLSRILSAASIHEGIPTAQTCWAGRDHPGGPVTSLALADENDTLLWALPEQNDLEELRAFLAFLGETRPVMTGAATARSLGLHICGMGKVMEISRERAPAAGWRNPSLALRWDIPCREVFAFLSTCFPAFLRLDCEGWCGDLSLGMRRGQCLTLCVVFDGQVIASATAYGAWLGTACLANVAVAPSWRRRGLGGELVGELCRSVFEKWRAAEKITLLSARPDSDCFYKSLGFCQAGEWAEGVPAQERE